MGNRSRYLAVTTAAVGGGALLARRRTRLRRAAAGIHDTILPAEPLGLPSDPPLAIDEAHAPGHQHRPVEPRDEPPPRPLRGRPWTKHGHGIGHPYSGR
jgi:hypothetical protein